MTTTKSDSITFADRDPQNPVQQQEVQFVDATPDEGYPIRILQAHLRMTDLITISDPPALGDLMNKWNDERAVILRKAIAKLQTP